MLALICGVLINLANVDAVYESGYSRASATVRFQSQNGVNLKCPVSQANHEILKVLQEALTQEKK